MSARYDNCKIQSPNDTFLGFCDKKKFNWYIKKGLACQISENTIKLNFEPKIKGQNKQFEDYYNREHPSLCVSCGFTENLHKFHVVPLEFRRHFPEELKSHASHDVLLLCANCQDDVNSLYHQYREYLLNKFNLKVDVVTYKMKTFVNKYLKYKDTMPQKYKDIYIEKFTEYLGHVPSDDEINELSKKSHYIGLANCSDVGEYIVSKYNEKGEILKFEEKWRKMFVDNLEPEFLPECW